MKFSDGYGDTPWRLESGSIVDIHGHVMFDLPPRESEITWLEIIEFALEKINAGE